MRRELQDTLRAVDIVFARITGATAESLVLRAYPMRARKMRSDKPASLIRSLRRAFHNRRKMLVASIHQVAASHRAYYYLALVPIFCWVGWAALFHVGRRHLSEEALYKAIDTCLYLSEMAGVVLVTITIRFRKEVNLVKLVMVSLWCGLLLAWVTFVGYMRVGFGCC